MIRVPLKLDPASSQQMLIEVCITWGKQKEVPLPPEVVTVRTINQQPQRKES